MLEKIRSQRRCALGALLLSVALSGCGSSSRKPTPTVTRPGVTHFIYSAAALVTMREYSPESLLWQTVWVRSDGSGVLTTLIGEQTGALQKHFRLPAGQMAQLRTLVAAARPVKPPPLGAAPRAELYTLYISGERAENAQGPVRRPLAKLIGFMSALMQTYCC